MSEWGKIKHFSHEHDLEFYDVINVKWSCFICNRSFGAGQHDPSGYACGQCYHLIHTKCAKLPQHINHSLHDHHHLTLAKRSISNTSTSSSCCYYCEEPFENEEYTYACDGCSNFHMHLTCAAIPLPTLLTSDVDRGQHHGVVQYACHQNPMRLVEHKDEKKERAKCFACHSLWSGPAYSCTLLECENFLHKSCADLQPKIKHPLHSRHPLILKVSKPRSCRMCCKKNCALIFNCHEDGCDFHLCPECVFLDTILVKCQSHDHLLPLVKNASCEIQCDACEKSYKNWIGVVPDEINHTRSFQFRCMECDFNLHFLCGPLPFTIKYEYHMHHLILLDHLNLEDDSDKCYCDVCENNVDRQFRIYYCEDCKYVAHIHCLIFEIMKAINDDTQDGKLKALGESRWDQFLTESIDDHAEGNTAELTFKDIMDRITDPAEKMIMIEPYGNVVPSKTFQRNIYKTFRQLNSRFDREGSINDIDKIQPLFCLDGEDDLENFCAEIFYYVPDEGLKIEEKYLRQKVENVGGYMVPKTLAPILRKFIHKNGDLGLRESLTPQMKSVATSLVCIVIDKMCRTKVEDVTLDDLKSWCFYLNSIRLNTGFNVDVNPFHQGPYNVLVRAFLGLEEIRCRETGLKNLRSKIAKLEADLERCKGLLEKHKVYDRSSASQSKMKFLEAAEELKSKEVGDFLFQM